MWPCGFFLFQKTAGSCFYVLEKDQSELCVHLLPGLLLCCLHLFHVYAEQRVTSTHLLDLVAQMLGWKPKKLHEIIII